MTKITSLHQKLSATVNGDSDGVDLKPSWGRPGTQNSSSVLVRLNRLSHQFGRSTASIGARASGQKSARNFSVTRAGVWSQARRAYVKPPGFGGRRVIVKARLVKLNGRRNGIGPTQRYSSGKAKIVAHMTYLSREGVSKTGEKGVFYDGQEKDLSPKEFIHSTENDDRQFRFILSPEDATAVDLTQFTRDLMQQIQTDLNTQLEWVAVNHYNTDNPHTHLTVRGVDENGRALFIHPEYIQQGIRYRAGDWLNRELGPVTPYERLQQLNKDIHAERYTTLDRTLESHADSNREINLSQGAALTKARDRYGALLKRVGWLEKQGFAHKTVAGSWRLDESMKAQLSDRHKRQLRLDALNKLDPNALQQHVIHGGHSSAQITGQVVSRGLSDELYDKEYMIIDAIDGGLHYVDLSKAREYERVTKGQIATIDTQAPIFEKPADKTIADLAAKQKGVYDPVRHEQWAQANDIVSPSAMAGYLKSFERRLHTLERKDLVTPLTSDRYQLPPDFMEQIHATDQRSKNTYQDGKVNVRLESSVGLKRQTQVLAVTWLDKQLVNKVAVSQPVGSDSSARDETSTFANQYQTSLANRRQFLIAQGLADTDKGLFTPRPQLLKSLRNQEIETVKAAFVKRGQEVVELANPGDVFMGELGAQTTRAGNRYATVTSSKGKVAVIPWRNTYRTQLNKNIRLLMQWRGDGLAPSLSITPVLSPELDQSLGRGR